MQIDAALDLDPRFVLAFYGLVSSPESRLRFFELAKQWFAELGSPPNKIGIEGPGFSGSLASFKRQAAKLQQTGFDNVESFAIYSCLPNVATPMLEYVMMATLSHENKYGGYGLVAVPKAFSGKFSWLPIADRMIKMLRPIYGIGYSRELSRGPDLYAIGMGLGTPLEPDITRWLRDGMGRQVYRNGILRNVYNYNFLTEAQLARSLRSGYSWANLSAPQPDTVACSTLESWIRGDAKRGSLTALSDGVTLWEVEEPDIVSVRKLLKDSGAIF